MATIDATHALEGNCVTGDVALADGPAVVYTVVLAAGSSADATLILYDNASAAAGERELYLAAAQKTSSSAVFNRPLRFNSGIYVDITGSGAYATIQYEED